MFVMMQADGPAMVGWMNIDVCLIHGVIYLGVG